MKDASDRLEAVLGHEVKVRRRSDGVTVEIRLERLDEVDELVRRCA